MVVRLQLGCVRRSHNVGTSAGVDPPDPSKWPRGGHLPGNFPIDSEEHPQEQHNNLLSSMMG